MIRYRLINGSVMIATLIGALYLPSLVVFAIIPLLAALMSVEFFRLLRGADLPCYPRSGIVGAVGLITLTGVVAALGGEVAAYRAEALGLALIVLAVWLRAGFGPEEKAPLTAVALTLLGVLYCGWLFNFYTKLFWFWPEGDGRWLLFYMILIVKVTDMGAFFTGCNLGRHKLCPRISPAKTREGCVGGVLAGLTTSLLFWWWRGGEIGPVSLTIANAIILGMVLPVVGILGDLIESLLKRAIAVKDSGGWVKGMGGILDILDSLMFAGPVLYGCLWWMTGR